MYVRVRSFWIYTTVNFFKTFFPLSVCVCYKYLVFFKKKKKSSFHGKNLVVKKSKSKYTLHLNWVIVALFGGIEF